MTPFSFEPELTERFQKGDEDAIRAIHRMYYRPLCYFVTKMIENQADAEDIATDSFLKLWDKHRDFEKLSAIRSFLFTTARNAALNHIRQKKTHERNHQHILYLSNQGEEVIRNEEAEAEILRILFREIEQLPPQCRKVFSLLSFKGYNTEQVAEKLGISAQTVRNQKSKAIQLLRSAMLKGGLSLEMTLIHLFVFILPFQFN